METQADRDSEFWRGYYACQDKGVRSNQTLNMESAPAPASYDRSLDYKHPIDNQGGCLPDISKKAGAESGRQYGCDNSTLGEVPHVLVKPLASQVDQAPKCEARTRHFERYAPRTVERHMIEVIA